MELALIILIGFILAIALIGALFWYLLSHKLATVEDAKDIYQQGQAILTNSEAILKHQDDTSYRLLTIANILSAQTTIHGNGHNGNHEDEAVKVVAEVKPKEPSLFAVDPDEYIAEIMARESTPVAVEEKQEEEAQPPNLPGPEEQKELSKRERFIANMKRGREEAKAKKDSAIG